MADSYSALSLAAPALHAFAITAGASALTQPTRALYVGGTGDVTVTMAGGEAGVVFAGVPAGTFLPIRVTHVTAATATGVVGLY